MSQRDIQAEIYYKRRAKRWGWCVYKKGLRWQDRLFSSLRKKENNMGQTPIYMLEKKINEIHIDFLVKIGK